MSRRVDTLVRLRVADDFTQNAARLDALSLRVLLSDPASSHIPESEKVDSVIVNPFWDRDGTKTSPPRKDVAQRLRVRVNNVLLKEPSVEDGWFVFAPDPAVLSVGENLVGILVRGRDLHSAPVSLEKLEVHVRYRAK
jgi:hypothetical protein